MNNRLERHAENRPFPSLKNFLWSSPRRRRILSAIIDLGLDSLVTKLGFEIVLSLSGRNFIEWGHSHIKEHFFPPIALMVVYFVLFLLKDAAGRSPGKILFGLRIVQNEERAPLWKRILRNVTIIIWPIEAAALLFTGRRLLDRLLGLDVVEQAEEK